MVTPDAATLVSLRETVQLTASALDASGHAISDKTFIWSSSDEGLATVSSSGLVTAVANGSVTITATADGANGTATLEVDQAATQLVFDVQPMTESFVDFPITPPVRVAIQDALGSSVAGLTEAVTMATGTNPSGGVLSGTTTVSTVDGIATFANLQIDRAGDGYTLVATAGTFAAATSAAFDVVSPVPPGSPVSLSAFGAATVDGISSAAEWDNAGRVHLLAKVPPSDGGGTTPTTLLVMNDGSHLYLALKIARSSVGGATNPVFDFDNDNDGARAEGDDHFGMSVGIFQQAELRDVFWTTQSPCLGPALCGLLDIDHGGTNDGTAAATNDGSFSYIEISHPLDSPDDTHDFSLASGDTVGFNLGLRLFALDVACDSDANFSNCVADTDFPSPFGNIALYGEIVIANSP
jgi:hypothetical protein